MLSRPLRNFCVPAGCAKLEASSVYRLRSINLLLDVGDSYLHDPCTAAEGLLFG